MKIITLIFLLFVSSTSLFAQEADVAQAVEKLKQALLDGKKESLEAIAHENLTYGHSSGLVEDRNAFVEALVTGRSDFQSITLSDQKIKVTGNVATVRHKLVASVSSNGTPTDVSLSILLVWIKTGNDWKLLARQATKI